MKLKKLTPCCTVDSVGASLPFWVERLGFKSVAEVPDGNELAFSILVRDGVTVMLQSRKSVLADLPGLARGELGGGVMLYIDVEDLDPVLTAIEGAEIVVPERRTAYGTREVWVRTPCGHTVGFAQDIPGKAE